MCYQCVFPRSNAREADSDKHGKVCDYCWMDNDTDIMDQQVWCIPSNHESRLFNFFDNEDKLRYVCK
jgi:hypothetical protein